LKEAFEEAVDFLPWELRKSWKKAQ
jgi:hypothetical protein